jgi:hypothetical protein
MHSPLLGVTNLFNLTNIIMKTTLLTLTTVGLLLFAGCSKENSDIQPVKSDIQVNQLKGTGWNNGYYYSYWNNNASGSATFTLGSGGNYSISWSNVGNFTCGKGWNPGSSTRKIGYNCGSYTCNGGGVFGLYGWTKSPLIEYYVNEKWGTSGRPTGTSVGTLSSDGGSYTIYKHQQVNQPSIIGTATFWQYFSTRSAQQGSGNKTITFANHVNAWKNKGLSLGSHDYQILLTEGYNSSGYCNATVWQQ